ncbi:uncharacterized protein LOC143021044 isoform X2 [Oratosquilla oratoria]|uniref:uncharacterized protein LOC143021044 isoform X2 n=1 Tax=Oratosquilla oratoria TaxID=337810 RepID=UPI003F772F33
MRSSLKVTLVAQGVFFLVLWIVAYGEEPKAAQKKQVLFFEGDSKVKENPVEAVLEGEVKSFRSFSLCLRVYILHFLYNSILVAYAQWPEDIVFALALDVGVKVRLLERELTFESEMRHMTWTSYCLAFDASSRQITLSVDGKPLPPKYLSGEILDTAGGRSLVLGNAVSGPSRTHESFKGNMTDFQMWSEAITQSQVEDYARCKEVEGNLVSWGSATWSLNHVESYEAPSEDFCTLGSVTFLLVPDKGPYKNAHYTCRAFGSEVALPRSQDETEQLKKYLKGVASVRCPDSGVAWLDYRCIRSNATLACPPPTPDNYTNWVTGFEFASWSNEELCVVVDALGRWVPRLCNAMGACTLCQHHTVIRYQMRGLCSYTQLDRSYTLEPEIPWYRFLGYQGSLIEFDQTLGWVMTSPDNTEKIVIISNVQQKSAMSPRGLKKWKVEASRCEALVDQVVEVVLTHCPEDHVTCLDGSRCVPENGRCNVTQECDDLSDEIECSFVRVPVKYSRYMPPPMAGDGHPLIVSLEVIIISYTNIDTINMELEMEVQLDLTWRDSRLKFKNLNYDHKMNVVTHSEMQTIWVPRVSLVNAQGHKVTEPGPEASMLVFRESDKLPDDPRDAIKEELFAGSGNNLFYSTKMTIRFACDMNVFNFPFDDQNCPLLLEFLQVTPNLTRLDFGETPITYKGSKELSQFLVKNVTWIDREPTRLVIVTSLYRSTNQYILKVFVPTMFLVCIACLTFCFRREDFVAKCTLCVQTMIVMAALFIQIQTQLPQTSYFKMVDVWMFSCLAIIFSSLSLHVLFGYLARRSQNKPGPVQTFVVKTGNLPAKDNGGGKVGGGGSADEDEEDLKDRRWKCPSENLKVSLIPCVFAVFNIVFWSVILSHVPTP